MYDVDLMRHHKREALLKKMMELSVLTNSTYARLAGDKTPAQIYEIAAIAKDIHLAAQDIIDLK